MPKPASAAPENDEADYLKYNIGGPYWTSKSDGEAVLQFSKKGYASVKEVPQTTLPAIFADACKEKGDKVAMRTENLLIWSKGDPIPEARELPAWKSWTYNEFHDQVKACAKAMIELGFKQHDSANIFGFNSPEWFIAAYAAMFAGGKAAGIYPSDNEEQVQFKSNHSNGSVAFVENEECLRKFEAVVDDLPYLRVIVCWACKPPKSRKIERSNGGKKVKCVSFKEFLAFGKQAKSSEKLQERLDGIKPSHCCALIYTSGTTGKPKAVMISHDNVVYEAVSVNKGCIETIGNKGEERIMSYLPLSHVAGMLVDMVMPLVISAWQKGWVAVHFARPYDIKAGSLVDRLKVIRPTIFFGVPRVWEKVMEKLMARSANSPDNALKKLIKSAKKRSLIYQRGQQLGGDGEKPKSLVVFNKLLSVVKGKLGLDKVKFVFAGAAPMTPECLAFFGGLGINVNEAYGMSESTGAVTFSTDKYHTWGSVGYEIPGTEVKIFKTRNGKLVECPPTQDLFTATEDQQGEICFRGRGVMMGYMANPRLGEEHVAEIEQKNREAIDENGWLHSGDKGCRDVRGMIKITGRYKELIIGAGGENIAPVPIEDELKKLCPFASNVMMIGNKRKFNVVLISLKVKGATGELPGGDELEGPAKTLSGARTVEEAMNDETFIKAITEAITKTNKNKSVTPSNAAKVQKFMILPRDFSVQTGELTATFKLKRSVVDDKYMKQIDSMYESKDVYVKYQE